VYVCRVGSEAKPVDVGGRGWDRSNERLPNWSPDGRYLAFYSDRGGGVGIRAYVTEVAFDSAGEPTRCGEPVLVGQGLDESFGAGGATRPAWSSDSRHIVAFEASGGLFQNLRLLPIPGSGDTRARAESNKAGALLHYDRLIVAAETARRGQPKGALTIGVSRGTDVFCAQSGFLLTFRARVLVNGQSREEAYLALVNF